MTEAGQVIGADGRVVSNRSLPMMSTFTSAIRDLAYKEDIQTGSAAAKKGG